MRVVAAEQRMPSRFPVADWLANEASIAELVGLMCQCRRSGRVAVADDSARHALVHSTPCMAVADSPGHLLAMLTLALAAGWLTVQVGLGRGPPVDPTTDLATDVR